MARPIKELAVVPVPTYGAQRIRPRALSAAVLEHLDGADRQDRGLLERAVAALRRLLG